MRNMSFAITTKQIEDETKTVTRRFGWWFLKPGDRVQAVKKAMGLKIGQKIERLKVIEVVSTKPETLNSITQEDVIAEGFPDQTPEQFVDMLVNHYKCKPYEICNRIEFRYIKILEEGK